MPIYGIYACDSSYGGLHGMNTYGFVECNDKEEADDIGRSWSFDVMESYAAISQSFRDEANEYCESEGIDPDSEEGDEFIENIINQLQTENLEWTVTKIRDDCPLTWKELRAREHDEFEELCSEYGEKEEN